MLVIDLKVLVKSFNCEDLSCYAGNPRESIFVYFYFWREFAKVNFFISRKFRESWIMNHYYFIILYAYTAC